MMSMAGFSPRPCPPDPEPDPELSLTSRKPRRGMDEKASASVVLPFFAGEARLPDSGKIDC